MKQPVYLALADEKTFERKGYIDFVDDRLDQDVQTPPGSCAACSTHIRHLVLPDAAHSDQPGSMRRPSTATS
jgi:hypothetical protein